MLRSRCRVHIRRETDTKREPGKAPFGRHPWAHGEPRADRNLYAPLSGESFIQSSVFAAPRHFREHFAMKRETLRPGQTINRSGIYVDRQSGETTTLVHGKTAPPTPEKGGTWREIVDSHPNKKG